LSAVLIAFENGGLLKQDKYGGLMEAGGDNLKNFNKLTFHNRVMLIYKTDAARI
jgi:hypothetical protein